MGKDNGAEWKGMETFVEAGLNGYARQIQTLDSGSNVCSSDCCCNFMFDHTIKGSQRAVCFPAQLTFVH